MRSHAMPAVPLATDRAGERPAAFWTTVKMLFAAMGEGLVLQRRYWKLTGSGLPSDQALHQALQEMDARAAQR
jgi:hypothetical protein